MIRSCDWLSALLCTVRLISNLEVCTHVVGSSSDVLENTSKRKSREKKSFFVYEGDIGEHKLRRGM